MPEYKHRLQVWKPYARTVAATAGAKYGFDPVTIAGLATAIAQLVNLFISCGKRNVDPNPETFQETVRERCSTAAGRRNLRNKLARRFAEHQSAVKGDREMYRGIADTMINQMLEEPPALVAACVAACGDDEYENNEATEPQDFVITQREHINVSALNLRVSAWQAAKDEQVAADAAAAREAHRLQFAAAEEADRQAAAEKARAAYDAPSEVAPSEPTG